MNAATWLPLLGSVLVSIVGGGGLGVWLMHLRQAPKSKAEARSITAAARDQDWARFQREIGRLVKRLEQAEDSAARAIAGQRACEAREADLKAEVTKLRAIMEARGEIRARAHEVVAADRAAGAMREGVQR